MKQWSWSLNKFDKDKNYVKIWLSELLRTKPKSSLTTLISHEDYILYVDYMSGRMLGCCLRDTLLNVCLLEQFYVVCRRTHNVAGSGTMKLSCGKTFCPGKQHSVDIYLALSGGVKCEIIKLVSGDYNGGTMQTRLAALCSNHYRLLPLLLLLLLNYHTRGRALEPYSWRTTADNCHLDLLYK